ncbi:aryl-sulfate sulfotransferase [Halosimplex aquaticum]|uniref:Aryl-sulfate sulfotransferase n=1 Tax=Halosimplex aquaticum TaxID=3026162 RepID=A0ABD5Y9I5_9EURY|nr:aryl-sulfate sulfotransferase [Halosimplex aquaticum]
MRSLPRRWRIRGALGVVLVALLALTAAAVASEESTAAATAIDSRAAAETIISVQGVRFRDDVRGPSPSRLFAVDGDGDVQWSYSGTRHGFRWLYDVDPLSNGNLLVTATVPGDTVVFEFDPETRTRAWTERFDARDTHDVDLINGDELLVANLRNYDVEANVSRDRVFVYNRTRDEIVWEWQFRDHYPESTDNGFRVGWTHLNDVDEIDDGRFLASPRNFDQAIVINRSTREIEMRLGRDDNRTKLFKQHNPDYLVGENGTPTMLVADSENDRVVEYARVDGEWERTWAVRGFHWPRDADRLPNGNTLVTDTKNNRVVEITPTGEVVWAVAAPWGTYEAERGRDGSHGPTVRQQNATGRYRVHGGELGRVEAGDSVGTWIATAGEGTPAAAQARDLGVAFRRFEERFAPPWLSSWAFAAAVLAGVVALTWAAGELAFRYRRRRRGAEGP